MTYYDRAHRSQYIFPINHWKSPWIIWIRLKHNIFVFPRWRNMCASHRMPWHADSHTHTQTHSHRQGRTDTIGISKNRIEQATQTYDCFTPNFLGLFSHLLMLFLYPKIINNNNNGFGNRIGNAHMCWCVSASTTASDCVLAENRNVHDCAQAGIRHSPATQLAHPYLGQLTCSVSHWIPFSHDD